MIFKRSGYLNKLIARKHNGLIKIVTGTRRAGKSFLLNELFYLHLLNDGVREKDIIRFAFDVDEDVDKLDKYFQNEPTKIKVNNYYVVNAKKFRAYIAERTNDVDYFYLILDEIQLLDNFVGTLNGFLRKRNFDVYVTGSNSKFLTSDIATEFRGRGSEVHVWPLTFKEYYEEIRGDVNNAWNDYLTYGGIPLIANLSEEEKKIYLDGLYKEIYLKDIVTRNNIRKKDDLDELFNVLASSIGAYTNPLKIVNTFQSVLHKKISNDSVKQYIEYLENAFLISKALRYNIKGRKYLGTPFKVYFEDVGVRNSILNFRQVEETHLMENIIYNELRYRGFSVDVGVVDSFVQTNKKDKNDNIIYENNPLEIDFVANSGASKFYIQSALNISDDDKLKQEKNSLYKLSDGFKKFLITKNGLKPTKDDFGVTTMDLFEFLLDEESLSKE